MQHTRALTKKYGVVVSFVLLMLSLQACQPEIPKANTGHLALSCGDLFAEYAEKPENIEFLKCTALEHDDRQKRMEAEYKVSKENSYEVEQFLVKRYGLMRFCDYSHAMPINEVHLDPKNLREIAPYYSLNIRVSHHTNSLKEAGELESIIHRQDCAGLRNIPFSIFVSIWAI